jgi:hypothetical protein
MEPVANKTKTRKRHVLPDAGCDDTAAANRSNPEKHVTLNIYTVHFATTLKIMILVRQNSRTHPQWFSFRTAKQEFDTTDLFKKTYILY